MTRPIRLMTLAPGHFHAALVQKHWVPGLHPRVHVYAPLDEELLAHISLVAGFNARAQCPTAWELDIRTGGDFLGRMLREQPGNTVVIAGRNRTKIDYILAAVSNGLHVVADKPWVINADDFAKLEQVHREADLRDVFAWDVMTERFEVATILQRELMRDPDVFGKPAADSPDQPALTLESTHYLRKSVAGVPLRRPAWWFDAVEAGPGLADVGTHLADLALWLLFPEQAIDHRRDVAVLDATIWPTPLHRSQFTVLTGLPGIPANLAASPTGEWLHYFGNGMATLQIRGVHVRLTVLWDYESDGDSGDTHEAVARGTQARVTVRSVQSPGSGMQPELFVEPAIPEDHSLLLAAVARHCENWQSRYPGVAVNDLGQSLHVTIPDAVRTNHEDHFADVFREFASYFHSSRQMPLGESWNLLTKYYITTTAVRLAQQKQAKSS